MKNLTILTMVLFLGTIFSYSQTKECDCSGALSKDLKDKFKETNISSLRIDLYEYYKAIKNKERRKIKNWNLNNSSESYNMYGYFKSTFGSSSNSSNSKKDYYETIIEKDKHISINVFKDLVIEVFGDNQLKAYSACLNFCSKSLENSKNGIFYEIVGDPQNFFTIRIFYYTGFGLVEQITLKSDAEYINAIPVGKNNLYAGNSIKLNDNFMQTLRVDDPNEPVIINLDFVNTKYPSIKIGKHKNKSDMPIGTIVVSILSYENFMKLNGYEITGNMRDAVWVPCNGRDVGRSDYGEYLTYVPDLRGLFIRGVNSYESDQISGVSVVDSDRENPDDTVAGKFQPDSFQDHKHKIGQGATDKRANTQKQSSKNRYADFQQNYNAHFTHGASSLNNDSPIRVSPETRPKNMTVYYYIKINKG